MSTFARIQTVAPNLDDGGTFEQWPDDWVSLTDHGVRIDYPGGAGHTLIPWHNVLRVDYIPSPTEEQ